MLINVSPLLKGPVGASQQYQVDELVAEDDSQSLVRGNIVLIRTTQGVLVRGVMTSKIPVTCSRCLGPFYCSVEFDIEEEFLSGLKAGSSLSEAPDDFTIDDDHVLDLSETFRQYIIAATPMRLLCHPDCAGVCPSCGQNLNQHTCQCLSHIYDQRWSKLVRLREESEV